MAFCEHCRGQRFDRSRGLRALRRLRNDLRANACGREVDEALQKAIAALRALDIPHFDFEDEDEVVVH